MPAILFGSISSVADTSEIQRQAFNNAFAEHNLDWRWDRDDYRSMLEASGGANRIADYAAKRGDEVDAKAIHETKSRLFQDLLSTTGAAPREGVVETIKAAKDNGWKVGLVTTTSRANIDALLSAVPDVEASDFDVIVDSSSVDQSKPDPAAYAYALKQLDVAAKESVAVEDNVEGVQAANAAGVTCVATPNENTAGHDFSAAAQTADALDPDRVTGLINAS